MRRATRLFAAFVIAKSVASAFSSEPLEIEDLIAKSEIVALVPAEKLELFRQSGVLLGRFFSQKEVIYYKGGPLPPVFTVRFPGAPSGTDERVTVSRPEGEWTLLFLKKESKGAYDPTSENTYQNGSFLRFGNTPPRGSVKELLIGALSSADEATRKNVLGVMERVDDPSILEVLRKMLPAATERDQYSIRMILESVSRRAEEKANVFSDEAAQAHFKVLFEQWKAAWNASNWAGLITLIHSENGDGKSWRKGGESQRALVERWQKVRAHGAITSATPQGVVTSKRSAVQEFLCNFADGHTMEWRGIIELEKDQSVKLSHVAWNRPYPEPKPR